jgi:hypothetical protein
MTFKIRHLFVYASILLAFCTYLTQYIFNFGEMVSEGLPLILGLFYFALIVKKNFKIEIIPLSIYLTILLIYTQLTISTKNGSYFQYIFLFYYLPVYLFFLYPEKMKNEAEIILKIITIMSVISAIVGITQYLNLQTIIPIDLSFRARGLSRSTLNYSSLLFVGYIAADNTKFKLKNLFKIIIFIGLISSSGRSGMLSVIIYEFIKNLKSTKIIILFLIFIVLFYFILQTKFGSSFENLQYTSNKLLNSFNFSTNDNSQRLASYLLFFDNFDVYGAGLGTTGPGAGRFTNNPFGFESFLLHTFYHGGIIALIFFPVILFLVLRNYHILSIKKISIMISYLAMMTAHQTFETPSVNIIAWLVIISSFNLENKFNNEK